MANSDYSAGRLFQMSGCTRCALCADVCPAVAASGDARLSGLHRLGELKRVLRRRTGLWRRLLGGRDLTPDQWRAFSETVFRCTLCGNCQEVCPAGIELKELWLELRQDLHGSSFYPKKIDLIRDNLGKSHNVFAEDNAERAEWVEECDDAPDDGFCRKSAEVVYFTGCVAAFYPVAQQIPVALAGVLQAAGVDFTLLGEDEWCCGFPLLGAGLKERAKEIIDHNLEAVAAKGAKQVVFACPSCFQMWREHYPYRGKVEIFHATRFLLRLIQEKRLELKPLKLKVTYHDPCDLGRGAREFEAPREVIKLLPGVEFVELARNREECQCCGGGGNLEMIDAELSAKITERKIAAVRETGAQAVITSCQQCVRTMTTYVRRNKLPLQVMDLTQLVKKALKK